LKTRKYFAQKIDTYTFVKWS